jgi:hypothetical protein
MSLSIVLEVAIGLMLVYYVLGLIVNIMVEEAKKLLQIRANTLEEMLVELLEDHDDASAAPGSLNVQGLMSHPLIENLKLTQQWFAGRVSREGKVEKISNTTFSVALLDALIDDKFRVEAVRSAIEQLPDAAMRQGLLDLIDSHVQDDQELLLILRQAIQALPDDETRATLLKLVDLGFASPEEQINALRQAIQKLPNGKTKQALFTLVDYSVQDLDQARQKFEGWFDSKMTKAGDLFKQRARSWVFICAFAVTFIIGADSIAVFQALWQQPARRTVIEAGVVEIMQEYEGTAAVAEIEPLVNELVALEIPVTWAQSPLPLDNGGKLLIKLAGLVITAIAASRGSSFWYDMLKRVNPNPASAGSKKEADET